jgi:hypothetical protein
MILKRFTSVGIERFNDYLDLLQTEPTRLVPVQLLEDSSCSEVFGKSAEIQNKTFENRYSAAEYLDKVFSKAGVADAERDVGLWAWLALFFFNELCPPPIKLESASFGNGLHTSPNHKTSSAIIGICSSVLT